MGQKLHRGRRSVFRKRRTGLKTFAWILVAVVIIAGGYLAAMMLGQKGNTSVQTDATPTISQTAPTPTESAKPTDPTTLNTDTSVTVQNGLRGFYLPHSMLSADTLSDTLAAAKQAGFTAVVFDLKDTEGRLYYRFSAAQAKQVNSYTDNALTKKQLKALFSLIKEAGLSPAPRLHAFRDNLGAKALPEARVSYKENPSWSWFDGKDSTTSKRWLSPYDNDAHDYIGALAEELKALGAGAVMLDSVQFPNPKLTTRASFGADNANLKWDEVLTLFVGKMKEQLGEDCPVILACTGESVLENATQIYGGNPLTFTPTVAAPLVSPDKVQESVEAMILRTNVMEENEKPLLAPMLDVDGCSATKVKAAIADCASGGTENYILYSSKGTYDFDAYQ